MTSRVLGVVREQVLAALFGAGDATDAYNVGAPRRPVHHGHLRRLRRSDETIADAGAL
jgi:hypothetical protein